VHLEHGEFERAAESFEAVVRSLGHRRHPASACALSLAAEARAQRGLALFHAACDAQAEAELSRALAARPMHPHARYYRARVYHRSGRFREAVTDLECAIAQRPGETDLHLLLAVCSARRGDGRRAADAMVRAFGLFGQAPCVSAGCAPPARGSGRRGGPQRGDRKADPLARWSAIATRVPGRARGIAQAAPAPPALEAMTRAVAERPSYADLRLRLALLLIETGSIAEAEVELERALRINPRYLEARLLLARLRLDRGRARWAVRLLEEALATHPGYPDLHFWLGLAHFRAGDAGRAVPALEAAVTLNREFARAQRVLGIVRFRMGRGNEALRSLERGFTRDREIREARHAGRWPRLSAGAPGPEEAGLRRAIALQPDYPDLHLELARARHARGDLEHAVEYCHAALGLKPDYSAAAMELARIELARGRPGEAEALLAGLVRRHFHWADAHALLGRAFRLRGDAAAAQEPLRTALLLNPGYSEARDDLAWALGAAGGSGKARGRTRASPVRWGSGWGRGVRARQDPRLDQACGA
jgi:tetratricopeptide (TPR) repeat protein